MIAEGDPVFFEKSPRTSPVLESGTPSLDCLKIVRKRVRIYRLFAIQFKHGSYPESPVSPRIVARQEILLRKKGVCVNGFASHECFSEDQPWRYLVSVWLSKVTISVLASSMNGCVVTFTCVCVTLSCSVAETWAVWARALSIALFLDCRFVMTMIMFRCSARVAKERIFL